MSKAAAQVKGKRVAAGKSTGGRAVRAKTRTRGTATWTKVLALIILFPFAAVLLPTTLVFSVMMAPTLVAYVTDRSRDKHLAVTVGMMNFAGTLPAVIDLWTRGQSHQTAMLLIGDVFVWAQAYGAAFVGWGIFAAMPTLVGTFYRVTTESRIKALVRQQKALVAEWGHAVAEGIASTVPPEHAEAAEEEVGEEPEVTEAEPV